jgi:hypothetical protein
MIVEQNYRMMNGASQPQSHQGTNAGLIIINPHNNDTIEYTNENHYLNLPFWGTGG